VFLRSVFPLRLPSILPLLGMLKFLDLPFRSQVCPVTPRLLPSHTCLVVACVFLRSVFPLRLFI
jgi:hypothetical protein